MRIFAIIILLLSLAGCSNDGEEILGAWKTEKRSFGDGKPKTLIFEKNRFIGKASAEIPDVIDCEYKKRNDVITVTFPNAEWVSVKVIDKDHIRVQDMILGGDYSRTTLEDIEAIKKAPAVKKTVPKDPF